jgi:hypothetical protein
VVDSQGGDGENDQWSLENHESDLIVGEVSTEAIPELGDAVDASYEDENGGGEQSPLEDGEVLGRAEMIVQRGLHAREGTGDLRAASAEDKVGPEGKEERHGDDLEDETGDHDVDTIVRGLWCTSSGRHSTTRALEYEREQVTADKNVRIKLGLETRVFAASSEDDATQTKVDARCEEGRCDGQWNQVAVVILADVLGGFSFDLHEEVVHRERIEVQHNSADISNKFPQKTKAHGAHECPCLAADAKP